MPLWTGKQRCALLLDRGADINTQSEDFGTVLQSAIYYDRAEVVALLLERGADLDADGGHSFYSAFHLAVATSEPEIVELLLNAGADVNARCYEDSPPYLHFATRLDTAGLLLDVGADVHARGGGDDHDALQAAVAYCRGTERVKLLLDRGADIDIQGGTYGNALQTAAAPEFRSIEMTRLLLDRGADVNAQCGKYGNALQAATVRHYTWKYLREESDMTQEHKDQRDQEQAMEDTMQAELVNLLLERGANMFVMQG